MSPEPHRDYVLSIDPGLSTGIALLSYTADRHAVLVKAWQFDGGLKGILRWVEDHWIESGWDGYNDEPRDARFHSAPEDKMGSYLSLTATEFYTYDDEYNDVETPREITIIAEKFTARNTKGFSYTTASLEPLRIEGALVAKDLMPDYTPKEKRWVQPPAQYIFGGKSLSDKKKRQHAWLNEYGFRVDRHTLGETLPDYDDARSAIAHGLSYIARELKHKPTFTYLTGETND